MALNQSSHRILFYATIAYVICREWAVVSTFDSHGAGEEKAFQESLFDLHIEGDDHDEFHTQSDNPSSKLAELHSIVLDNQMMREMYLMSLDQVIIGSDIQKLMIVVGSNPDIKRDVAVSTIVNLKLIQKLQFQFIYKLYAGCEELDHQRDSVHNTSQFETSKEDDEAVKTLLASSIEENLVKFANSKEPECMMQSRPSSSQLNQNCSLEVCRFYLHCVLHRRQCTDAIIEIATTYFMKMKDSLPFMTGDTEMDISIVKAIVLSQFADPSQGILYSTSMIKEHGQQVGLLHARILARVRTGLTPQTISLILQDTSLALSLDEYKEESICRKAAVLLAISQYFDALELIELGLTSYPNNADLYQMKGACHFQLQELAEAEVSFQKALQLNVNHSRQVMQKLGLVLYRQGKLANAIVTYKELLMDVPCDSNVLISISHCYRQQGEGKRALSFANKAVKFSKTGKIQLLFRGNLYHSLGNDHMALEDFKSCLKYHKSHELCIYHAALSYANLGQFFEAAKCLVKVTSGIDISSPRIKPNSHYIKASYLINYYRYIHSKLDQPLTSMDLDRDLRPAFKHGWVKGTPLDMNEYFASEQKTMSPDIPVVVGRPFTSYDRPIQKLLCKAQLYGKIMQVKADSFLPNRRFNLAMGLAALHVGQYIREVWIKAKKSSLKKLKWRDLYDICVPYRRLADLETPVLWFSRIYNDDRIVYHNEVPFYRSQVKNLRMKSYFDYVFRLMRRKVKDKITAQYSQNAHRIADVDIAKTPEDLVSIGKSQLPSQLFTIVPSIVTPKLSLDGATIVLSSTAYGAAHIYMDVPTTVTRTREFDIELTDIYTGLVQLGSKLRTNSVDHEAAIDEMLSMAYFFFNLAPLSRGSASVGLSTLMGMFLAIDREIMMSFPAGKMLDMEAILAGGRAEFLISVKHWFKLLSLNTPITALPLVSDTFPTVRSLLEVLSFTNDFECDDE